MEVLSIVLTSMSCMLFWDVEKRRITKRIISLLAILQDVTKPSEPASKPANLIRFKTLWTRKQSCRALH